VNETIDVAALHYAYDVTASSTHYMTATAHADGNEEAVAIVCPEGRDITGHDWDEILDHFNFRPEFFDMHFAVEDGLDIYVLTRA
jgi:hypothetical protein